MTIPAPGAPGAAPPAAPVTPAVPAPPPAPVAGDRDITESTLLEFDGADGKKEMSTIGELVTLAQKPKSDISPEELERFQVFNKAMSGDRDAIRSVMESHLPPDPGPATPGAPAASVIETPEYKALAERQARTEQELQQVKGPIEQIETAQLNAMLKQTIEAQKGQVPLLAKHPNAAQIVHDKLKQVHDTIQQSGTDPTQLDAATQAKVWAYTFRSVENELQHTLRAYGLAPEPSGASAGSQVTATDDQGRPGHDDGRIPGRLQIGPGGQTTDAAGNPIVQTPHGTFVPVPGAPATPGAGGTLPTDIPSAAARGQSVPAGTTGSPPGPQTRDQITQQIKQRNQEMQQQ